MLVFLTPSKLSSLAAGIDWKALFTPKTSGSSGRKIRYFGGRIFCCTSDPTGSEVALASSDGMTWTSYTTGFAGTAYDIAYDGRTYVLAGAGGALRTSTDLKTWSTVVTGTTFNVWKVVWNGSYFLAFAVTKVFKSVDGRNWTTITPPVSLYAGIWDGSKWYAVGSTSHTDVYQSTDGSTWTKTVTTSINGNDITYANGYYAIAGQSGAIGMTTNPTSWTTYTMAGGEALAAIDWVEDRWMVGCNTSKMYYSLDTSGNSWTGVTTAATLSYGYGKIGPMYVGAAGLQYSSDGTTWNTRSEGTVQDFVLSRMSDEYAISLYPGNRAYYSQDGENWNASPVTGAAGMQGIMKGLGLWVATSNDNKNIYSSPDRVNWTLRTTLSVSPHSGCFFNGQFLVPTSNGYIYRSTDGINWSSVVTGTGAYHLFDIKWYPAIGKFIATGSTTTYGYSSNGTTWTFATLPTTLVTLAGSSSIVVLSGSGGAIYTTTDGINWTVRTSGTTNPVALAYDGVKFVGLGTNSTTAIESADGITWTASTTANPLTGTLRKVTGSDFGLVSVSWSASNTVFDVYKSDNSNAKTETETSDPYRSNVVFHARMNGSNGRAEVLDEMGHAVTVTTPAALTNTKKRYGQTALLCNSTAGGRAYSISSDYAVGTNDFTIDFYALPDAKTYTSDRHYFSLRDSATTGLVIALRYDGTWAVWTPSSSFQGNLMTTGQPEFVRLTRINGVAYLSVNGRQSATFNMPANIQDTRITIGGGFDLNAANPVVAMGAIDEVRITRGIGRIPYFVPTYPFMSVAQPTLVTGEAYYASTVVDLAFEELPLVDGRGHIVNVVGSITLDTNNVTEGVARGVFNGSSYAKLASSDFIADTQDFTIEGYINPSVATDNGIFQLSDIVGGLTSTEPNNLALALNSSAGGLVLKYGASSSSNISVSVTTGQTVHVAVCRYKGSLMVFFGGTKVLTVTDTTRYTAQYLAVGGYQSTSKLFSGYIDGFKFFTNVAKYVTDFTPTVPGVPLTTLQDSNSAYKLVQLDFNSWPIRESASNLGLCITGNVSLDTTRKIEGKASGWFDGASYIQMTTTSFAFDTGAFTIEAWVTPDAAALTAGKIAGIWQLSSTAGGIVASPRGLSIGLSASGSSGITISYGSGAPITISNTWNAGDRKHMAMCKSGGTLRVYLAGNLIGSYSDTYTYTNEKHLVVGACSDASWPYKGLIELFRVYKGIALYTGSTYTPQY